MRPILGTHKEKKKVSFGVFCLFFAKKRLIKKSLQTRNFFAKRWPASKTTQGIIVKKTMLAAAFRNALVLNTANTTLRACTSLGKATMASRATAQAHDQLIPKPIACVIGQVKSRLFGPMVASDTRYFLKHRKIDEFAVIINGQQYIDRKLCEDSLSLTDDVVGAEEEEKKREQEEKEDDEQAEGYAGTHVSFIVPCSAAAGPPQTPPQTQMYIVLWDRRFKPDANYYMSLGAKTEAEDKDGGWARYIICKKLED
jgi:hypothetical protein